MAFVVGIVALLAVDLFFHDDEHEVSMRQALLWSAFWISLGLGFTAVVWAWHGPTVAGEYIAGYLIEYSLSVDNIFVFVMLLSYFVVPAQHQHRVLFWGFLGALVFRAVFITVGAALLHAFAFMTYIFGAFLLFTAVRMAIQGEVEVHPDRSVTLRAFRRIMPMTDGYRGGSFFTTEDGRRRATQLLAVLVFIEVTDIVFAVDSIPAIFAVTKHAFIVFSSNAFAILGLRSLYFVVSGMVRRFKYLQIGLALVLGFVGVKMLISHVFEIPIWMSLGVIVGVLAISVVASLFVERQAG